MVRVLIIDDDLEAVQVLSELLEIHKIKVVGKGHDGKQAVELYEKLKPDVIVLDMKMPNFDGEYAIEKIKEIDPDCKIITVSGYGTFDLRDENVFAFFPKPYDIEKIVEAIKKIPVRNHK